MNNRGDKRTLRNEIPSTSQRTPKKQRQNDSSERTGAEMHIKYAKRIMAKIKCDISQYACEDNTSKKLTDYIIENIRKLDTITKKKTTVGVFGKTGAGKSSLINAILGEKELLPSGTVNSCTSVITQVEANLTDFNYTAEIEFISKQDWENELNTLLNVLSEDGEEKDGAIFSTANEKITALYGEDGVFMSVEDLMKDEHFSEIPEFLKSGIKKITCKKSSDLSDEILCYVQHDDSGGCYWPVVKSVTIRVPKCKDFLEHILLVDLPGTGDYNKTRDQMWRSKLRECSTVWIISEIKRAGSDKETWELVSSSITDMARGGECSSISFICTMTDVINPQNYMRKEKIKDKDLQLTPEDSQYSKKKKNACILHRNNKAKKKVEKIFSQQETIQRHFNCDENFLSVFTVSSEEFTNEGQDSVLKPEQTEIPDLKDLLKKYNNCHINEVATRYISGALGILYLIQGSKSTDDDMVAMRSKIHSDLETNLQRGLEQLKEYCNETCSFLEDRLSVGARESEEKCVEDAQKVIKPKKDGRGFHQTLTALCKNEGFYRSRKGLTDLNTCLAKHMLMKINKTFSDVFPVKGNMSHKSLQGNIDKFTMITKELNTEYENSPALSHIVNFLKMEEKKLKTMLSQEIVERKKEIYDSLSESIKTTMQQGYKSAAACSGTGSMARKQELLLNHIESSKSEMFQKAKSDMLKLMEETMNYTQEEIKTTLMESIDYSLKENTFAGMDVNKEIKELKRLLKQI